MSEPMTVGDLRKSLEGVPDELLVLATYDGSQTVLIERPRVEVVDAYWLPGHEPGDDYPQATVFRLGEHDYWQNI